jgi:hypothetical protein
MKNVICFLLFFWLGTSNALVPLEGIIFGGVQDIQQYDPFSGVLSFDYTKEKTSDFESQKIQHYYALYKQGTNLKNQCEKDPKTKYSDKWQKAIASRSIAATLQYIGLDLSLKAIAKYAKKLEYSKTQYATLTNNLIKTTCSNNLSVYSLKLIEDNFKKEWDDKLNILPTIKSSPYFESDLKKRHNTMAVTKREFDYTLRNFRAFCSWNSDSSDYRMLVPYLKNPYIMSVVFNNMNKKKLSVDQRTNEILLKENLSSAQVACEDLICRNRSQVEFKRIYPRMIGSTKLNDDFTSLYCDHFLTVRYMKTKTNAKIKQWLKEQSLEESKLETLNFISLLTNVPDALIIAENYGQIHKFIKNNIKERWDKWAEKKIGQFHNDHLYEEPLEVKLVSQKGSEKIKNGEFHLLFDVGLSEIDKVLDGVDKIDSYFDLDIPAKYLAYIRDQSSYHYNRSEFKKSNHIEENFIENIKHQLKSKKQFFKIPIWNEEIAGIIAEEIMVQASEYRGSGLNKLSKKKLKIPVRFRFGIFALHYIRQKNKYLENERKTLTFN